MEKGEGARQIDQILTILLKWKQNLEEGLIFSGGDSLVKVEVAAPKWYKQIILLVW